jgi:hypothetical protein
LMVSGAEMDRVLAELAAIRERLDVIVSNLGCEWVPSARERELILRRAREAEAGDTVPLAEVKARLKRRGG